MKINFSVLTKTTKTFTFKIEIPPFFNPVFHKVSLSVFSVNLWLSFDQSINSVTDSYTENKYLYIVLLFYTGLISGGSNLRKGNEDCVILYLCVFTVSSGQVRARIPPITRVEYLSFISSFNFVDHP